MAHHKSADPSIFILPDLGEGVHEAELLKWRVAPGQAVSEHDILADMEHDKAVVEVPSPRSGIIAALHGAEGEILKVGNPLVTYVRDGAQANAPTATPAPTPAAKDTKAATPAPSATPEPVSEPAEEREDAGTVVGMMRKEEGPEPGKALATPAVRRLARDLGVDIDRVAGTGIAGRVTEKDVRSAASGGSKPTPQPTAKTTYAPTPTSTPTPAPSRPTPPRAPEVDLAAAARVADYSAPGETTRVPFRGVRRTIANRLRESVDQAVHFTVMDEADVSTLDALRRKLASASGEKVSFLPFVASAACRVLSKPAFAALNATVDETPGDPSAEAAIIRHRSIHLGIATDTDSGLMVPVIRDADRLGVLQIGRAIASFAEQARTRAIARENLIGGTFTITNVGSHAGRFATPVINYPEAAILAVGRARPGAVVRHGGIFVGNLLPLSLACDHRVVDGATAALALAEIIALLQDHPDSLLGPARGA
ncbi:MAG: 2-oxo acid dehydrogenase subunit E2 [Phycisphaeraceae bacterium]|nr:MAG: 2-oxo acid dehydrogenase subunit E2 [Phycisphaeraceae bacterium]